VIAREGGEGGIAGWIIVLVVIDVNINIQLLTLTLTLKVLAMEMRAAESRTAFGGTGWQRVCSCRGERLTESVPIRGREI
jgi:hypothetical protein